jgi:hypothetical protein
VKFRWNPKPWQSRSCNFGGRWDTSSELSLRAKHLPRAGTSSWTFIHRRVFDFMKNTAYMEAISASRALLLDEETALVGALHSALRPSAKVSSKASTHSSWKTSAPSCAYSVSSDSKTKTCCSATTCWARLRASSGVCSATLRLYAPSASALRSQLFLELARLVCRSKRRVNTSIPSPKPKDC